MLKRIFIYEPHAAGHHTAFLRVLLAAFRKNCQWHTTILTSEEAERHPAFKRLADEFRNEIEIVVAGGVSESPFARRLLGSFYAEQFANFKSLRREFGALNRERSFDFALIPYMEAVGIHNLALRSCFSEVLWAVIPHGLRVHFRDSGIKAPPRRIDFLQRLCFMRMLRMPTLAGIFTLDRYLVKWANHPKVMYVACPVPQPPSLDQQACRNALGLPEKAIVILVYGAIDGRKCLDLLFPAVAQAAQTQNVLLVVAGIQDLRLRKALLDGDSAIRLKRESRLVEFNRFVTAEEEQMLFTAADIVWSYNRDSLGLSAVLVTAGQFSKPVLLNPDGLASKIASDERCGLVVERSDPTEVAHAIVKLSTQPALRREMGARAYAHFSEYTPEAFADPISAAIEAATFVARPAASCRP